VLFGVLPEDEPGSIALTDSAILEFFG